MQHGRVEIVDVHAVFDGVVADVVRGAVDESGLDAAAGYPDRIAVRIVVASVAALADRRAPEFAGPDDQRLVQQPTPFQVADQRRLGLRLPRLLDINRWRLSWRRFLGRLSSGQRLPDGQLNFGAYHFSDSIGGEPLTQGLIDQLLSALSLGGKLAELLKNIRVNADRLSSERRIQALLAGGGPAPNLRRVWRRFPHICLIIKILIFHSIHQPISLPRQTR